MSGFRKNVAGQNYPFVLINASTGAALTGATVTAKRSIDGAAQASATGTVTELAGGQYNFAPSQADTNGNQVGWLFTATGAIPHHVTVVTTAADPTDAVRYGLAALANAAAGATGGLPTVDAANGVKLSVGTGAGQLNVSGGKAPATLNATDVTGNIPTDMQTIKTEAVTCAAPVTVLASVGTAATNTAQTGDAFARLGAPANASIAADIAEIEAETDAIGTPMQAGASVTLAANQHVIVDSGTVTTLTNLPPIPANWLTAAGIAAGALNGKGDWATSGGSGSDPLLNAGGGYVADSIGYELHQLYRKAFADHKIDRTTSPGFTEVWFDPGTSVEVLRLRLLDLTGNPVTQATTIVAQEVR